MKRSNSSVRFALHVPPSSDVGTKGCTKGQKPLGAGKLVVKNGAQEVANTGHHYVDFKNPKDMKKIVAALKRRNRQAAKAATVRHIAQCCNVAREVFDHGSTEAPLAR